MSKNLENKKFDLDLNPENMYKVYMKSLFIELIPFKRDINITILDPILENENLINNFRPILLQTLKNLSNKKFFELIWYEANNIAILFAPNSNQNDYNLNIF